MSEISELRFALEKRKGQKENLQLSLQTLKGQIRDLRRDLLHHEQAREIVRQVGLATQQQLQFHISEITSLALGAVFPDPYEMIVDFTQRRNRTECDLLFQREDEKVDPLSATGGGAVDVAAFALRVASWSMSLIRSRNTLVLDEPFRYLSANLLPKAGEMLKQISQELNLQIIMVTHAEELVETADKIFTVSQRKGVSIITTNDKE